MKLQERHLKILIPKSKTDQHREEHVVHISRIKSECCPVKYIEAYLQKVKLDISNVQEIISLCRIFKTMGFRIPELRKLKATYIPEITTMPENFGLHSGALGGASAAANNGILDRLISKLGRWSSGNAGNGYIKDSKVRRLTVSNMLGL